MKVPQISIGVLLKDTLMVGPTIQDDRFTLLTRFRLNRYALTAEIEKMYRQVLVHLDDAIYQKNLFRKDPEESVKEFSLHTVTYGTSCASLLAIRALHQLADDEGAQHPIAAALLKTDFYVDDLLTGAKTREEAVFFRDDLAKLLQKGGLLLRKWASNDATIVPENSDDKATNHMSLNPSLRSKNLRHSVEFSKRFDLLKSKLFT